jgi:hypothetical protein
MLNRALRRTIVVAAALLAAAGAASADEFLDKINATFKATRQDQHSEGALLPVLAKLDPLPKSLAALQSVGEFALLSLSPAAAEWKDAVAWATAPNQKAALEAMSKVTRETDWRRAQTMALPYGTDGVPIDLIRSGLYCELGDPPTLAAVTFGYLKSFDTLRQLSEVEASRRQAEGDAAGALKVAIDWTLVARQLIDRRYGAEVVGAMKWTIRGLERVRDIAYQDFRGARKLDVATLQEAIKRLSEDGPLSVERMRFPDGDLVAAEQLVSRMYGSDGQINAEVFSATMARTGASQHPLQLFSETAKWRGVGAGMPDKSAMLAELKKLNDDWASRWGADAFDPIMSVAWEYPKMDRGRFMLIAEVIPDLTEVFGLRQALRAESVGTRHALGLFGFSLIGNSFPLDIAGIRPRFLKEIEMDPFNPNRKNGAKPPMAFFVPMRDTKDQFPGRTPEPSELAVIAPNGENFTARLGQDQFVLYSVGADGARNWARRVQNTPDNVPNADYLIWPPVVSLYRLHLIEAGKIK